jgi:hypothetical protein
MRQNETDLQQLPNKATNDDFAANAYPLAL